MYIARKPDDTDVDQIRRLYKFALQDSREGERPIANFALGFEIYFTNGLAKEIKDSAFEILKEYYELFPDLIDTFDDPARDLTRSLNGNLSKFEKSYEEFKKKDKDGGEVFLSGLSHSEYFEGRPEPHFYEAEVHCTGNEEDPLKYLSFFSCHLPLLWVIEDPDKVNHLLKKWSTMLNALVGVASPTIILWKDSGLSRHGNLIHPFLNRFLGLNFHSCFDYSFQATSSSPIKCCNWLTFINHENDIDWDKLAKEKQAFYHIDSSLNGTLYQLSEFPYIGDLNAGVFPPSSYKILSDAAANCQFKDYEFGLIDVDEDLDEIEETLKWTSRFNKNYQ